MYFVGCKIFQVICCIKKYDELDVINKDNQNKIKDLTDKLKEKLKQYK